MKCVVVESDFESWRAQARVLLAQGLPPEELLWSDSSDRQGELFLSGGSPTVAENASPEIASEFAGELSAAAPRSNASCGARVGEPPAAYSARGAASGSGASPNSEMRDAAERKGRGDRSNPVSAETPARGIGGDSQKNESPPSVPKRFLSIAEAVACHADECRWALLYRLVWRLTRGGEPKLLYVATDADVRKVAAMAKEVGREIHKMRAFVRFRKVGESPSGREQFVAWFEPTHRIVERNADFFRRRFAGMDWSILTPQMCAHWDGEDLCFTEGVSKAQAPDADALEALWRTYYRSIFNPSRLKLRAMQSEMPKKYWRNLPEAPLIAELASSASRRRDAMVSAAPVPPKPAPKNAYLDRLKKSDEPHS